MRLNVRLVAVLAVFVAMGVAAVPASGRQPSVKVTVAPASVDLAAPPAVSVTPAEDAGRARLLEATTARVNGTGVAVKATATGVMFTPPTAAGEGPATVTLVDARNATVATFEIAYTTAKPAPAPPPAVVPNGSAPTLSAADRESLNRLTQQEWFPALVGVMFLLVVGPFVFAIVMSVYRGRSEINPDNRPLGLPVGSFRSILAYSLVAYLGFYVLTSVMSGTLFNPPEFLLGIVATVIGFYFGSRSEEAADREVTAGVRGQVTHSGAPARGAIVSFTRTADGTVRYSRITDVDGRFELSGATPGKYTVRATATGASPSAPQDLNLTAGSDHEVAIELTSPAPAPNRPPAPNQQPDPAGPGPAGAPTGALEGVVTDQFGPVEGATVVLSQAGATKFTTVTGAAGNYKVDGLPAGTYQVQASLGQVTSEPATVQVGAGTQTADLRLP
jgi:hypothetical protein